MGKYLDKFKNVVSNTNEKIIDSLEKRGNPMNDEYDDDYNSDSFYDNDFDDSDRFDDNAIRPAQKPKSFHHFILENQYKDLERSIRGFKDVFDKNSGQWVIKRKEQHCFTDEEAENILRTAQSHLATDIKLGFISKEAFPMMMDAIYEEIAFLFERIAEYRYGRYGAYEKQGQMKEENQKIFLELFSRIQANYSRSIQGQENRMTHDSVKGQESLQGDNDEMEFNRGYS